MATGVGVGCGVTVGARVAVGRRVEVGRGRVGVALAAWCVAVASKRAVAVAATLVGRVGVCDLATPVHATDKMSSSQRNRWRKWLIVGNSNQFKASANDIGDVGVMADNTSQEQNGAINWGDYTPNTDTVPSPRPNRS